MNIGVILSAVEIILEVYQDHRKDRYLKKYLGIKDEFQAELNKGITKRSDLRLDELRHDAEQLLELVIS